MPNDRPTLTEVIDKLQTYGTANQLAAFFEEQGVCGVRGKTTACPIARHVGAVVGAPVSVSAYYVMAKTEGYDEVMIGETMLTDFISAFDRGEYPALEQVSD